VKNENERAKNEATAMNAGAKRMLLTGNHAVAWGARLARPKVVPVYPITPQTPVLELLTEFHAAGEFDAEMLTPESEHSVMAACIPASLAGVRVFTATASQGLMLMHELLHYASGARAPIVMANVNRTIASPWAFWPDQTDSLAQRDTGWVQLYVESAQEALDSVIQAFRIAERVLLPVMVNLDAFYVSHALEPVQLPVQETVDAYLPPYAPEHFLDPARGESWGNVVSQELYCRHRRDIGEAMDRVPAVAAQADQEWQRLTGRGWGVMERYRCEGADLVITSLGSMCGTAREAVDALRAVGHAVGLLKLRLFRPLPLAALRAALAGVRDVLVLDRNFSPGAGGVLHQELRAALYGMPQAPRVHGLLAGVGGVNVPPQKIVELALAARSREPAAEPLWANG
jgi:pyruvate/2-oxoacid:ferredoxin oxidoreductase alpha subunit